MVILLRNLERSRMLSLAAAMKATTTPAVAKRLSPDVGRSRLSKAGYVKLREIADAAQARTTLWWGGTGLDMQYQDDSFLGHDNPPLRLPAPPEIAAEAALAGGRPVMAIDRFDGHPTALVARNLNPGGRPAVLLLSSPLADVRAQVAGVKRRFYLGGVLAFLAALGLGLLAATSLSR